jgi:hypothetical protein
VKKDEEIIFVALALMDSSFWNVQADSSATMLVSADIVGDVIELTLLKLGFGELNRGPYFG